MTEKRFTLICDDGLQLYDFIEDNGKVIHTSKVVDLLNELYEENQLVKDTLNELKSIDGFWDSALLQGYISKIANIFGVDLE